VTDALAALLHRELDRELLHTRTTPDARVNAARRIAARLHDEHGVRVRDDTLRERVAEALDAVRADDGDPLPLSGREFDRVVDAVLAEVAR
jgi:hypothetical protein